MRPSSGASGCGFVQHGLLAIGQIGLFGYSLAAADKC